MRIAIMGSCQMAQQTAKLLIEQGHEVVIIDRDKEKIRELSEKLDCSFLCGVGSKPEVMEELNPKETDILFCLTDEDQDNVIASLIGRSLGIERVVTRIEDMAFEGICKELGLDNLIVPSLTIGQYLTDYVRGVDILELSTALKDEARVFSVKATEVEAVPPEKLDLPEQCHAICFYRRGKFALVEDSTEFKKNDEIILLTHSKNLEKLQERWNPKNTNNKG